MSFVHRRLALMALVAAALPIAAAHAQGPTFRDRLYANSRQFAVVSVALVPTEPGKASLRGTAEMHNQSSDSFCGVVVVAAVNASGAVILWAGTPTACVTAPPPGHEVVSTISVDTPMSGDGPAAQAQRLRAVIVPGQGPALTKASVASLFANAP